MDFQDIIIKKRDKQKLTKEEISFFIQGVTDGSLPDYQISALLMAILLNGMDAEETAQMTMEMAHSGALFNLSSLPGFKVDKHSTGGVGDTTTLILAPLVASLGVPVVKMSGRGLGFSGGTIDKLESIPGFQVGVTEEDALTYGKTSHLVLMSQTDNLTPADKKLYALRDVTGTVDSIPLIAASIMSKKIAAGANGIVLDVKCGSGAFMKTQKDAEALAHIMVEMGQHVGRKITAIISGMDQPLGMYIGNSLEVMEAMEVLKGNVKGDLLEVSLLLGAHMLLLAGRVQTEAEGKALLQQQIDNGAGIAKFRELLIRKAEILPSSSSLTYCPFPLVLWKSRRKKAVISPTWIRQKSGGHLRKPAQDGLSRNSLWISAQASSPKNALVTMWKQAKCWQSFTAPKTKPVHRRRKFSSPH